MSQKNNNHRGPYRGRFSSTQQSALRFKRSLLYASISFSLAVTQIQANPTGGSVVAGSATISAHGHQLDIHQNSQRAIINWQSFSIGVGEVSQFHQPSADAAVLNRVTSADPSQIYGTLRANGHVYLVNPNGIVVGKNGRIDTHSFVASTMDVSNAEFLSGGDMTFAGSSDSTVVNLGHIDAVGGDVYLIAHKVLNEGEIRASGEVGLAAGSEVLLRAAGDQRISIRLTAKDAQVDQLGLIESVRVQLAAAGENPYALAINHEGITRAKGVENRQGRILLSADSGSTRVSGEMSAAGGDIHVLGDQVTLAENAVVDVSSATGGGEILVGGNLQGRGPEQNALQTIVESGVQLRADATVIGDGGRVIVWADESTRVGGAISARGGQFGGDGGFIETSAKKDLVLNVDVDASAPKGAGGQWLIDPESITIDRAMADSIEKALDSDTSVLVTTYTGWPLDEADTSTDREGTELIASTPNLSDPGHITVNAAITKRIGDQAFTDTRSLKPLADVAKGAFVEALVGDENPVLLLRREANASGDLNVVEQSIKTRLEAEALVAADSALYQIEELADDIKVVWQVEREVAENFSVPTLELLSPEGNIYVNEAITSVNGQLNVVLNAGARADFTNRDEGVYINADILTNGGSLLVRGGGVIDVADNTLLSTRDVFGVDSSALRFLASDDNATRQSVLDNRDFFTTRNPAFQLEDAVTVSAEKLSAPWHNSAASQGWSGDIMMMVDKNIGYSNFFLFYRSDVSAIRIGQNARLLAHADEGREGSVRMLSLANLTDLFESSGWLGVRNYAQSTIEIGDGTWITGGVIDLIADARSDADVGSVIEMVTRELADATDDSGLVVTAAVNNESEVLTAGENISRLIMDIGSSGKDINTEINNSDSVQQPDDFSGFEGQAKLPIAQLGTFAVDNIDEIPFIGQILSLSPIAIAIAETDAQVVLGNNVQIRGGDQVTLNANAESSATGTSVAPGLALSLTVTNANSEVTVGTGSEIVTLGGDNLGASLDPLSTGKPFLAFKTTDYFGVSRQYLNTRPSADALLINASSSTSSSTSASSGALTEEIASSILQRSEEDRAKAAGESTQADKSVDIDSPVDISLGLSFVKNRASLNLAAESEVEARNGSVAVLTQATNSLVSSITGGSVIQPEVNLGEQDDGSDATLEAPLDANDIINVGISVQYSDVKVTSEVDGTVRGQQVNIAASSKVDSHANTVTADNGYATFDKDSAVEAQLKADASRTETATRKVKEWLSELVSGAKDQANSQTNETIPTEDGTAPADTDLGIAGAVAITVADYNVSQRIGGSALIEAIEPDATDTPALSVTAKHNSGVIHNSANAGVHTGRKNAVALAVAISALNNSVDVEVADDATLRVVHGDNAPLASENATSAIVISADAIIESPFSLDAYGADLFGTSDPAAIINEPEGFLKQFSPIEMGKNTVTRLIQNGNLISTNWANGYVVAGSVEESDPSTIDDTGPSTDIAIGGSFGFLYGKNIANVTIGAATIEVIGGSSDTRNAIDLSAKSWAHTILAAGTIAPPEFAGEESNTLELDDIFNGESAGAGIGGAINLAFVRNEAHVNVLDGARLTTLGDLSSRALSHYETVLIQVAGGKAEDVAISGAFGLNWLDLHASSLIADGAIISVRDLDISAATNMPGNLVMSGGFAFSEATGIGAGAAINRVVRSTVATLGHEGVGDQAEAGGSVEARNVQVDAISAGFMTGIAIAGGIQTPGSFGGTDDTTQVSSVGDDDAEHKSSGGLGISGSVAVNLSVSETLARVRLPVSDLSGLLAVSAVDAVDITGISGAAALTVTGGAAIAGAASINRIESRTIAEVLDTQADTLRGLAVDASSIGRIQGISAGMAVTTEVAGANEDDGPEFAAAGSFVFNEISNDTNSRLFESRILLLARPEDDESELEERDAVRVTATDGSRIFAVAGAVAVDATSGSEAAIGAGVAINLMQGAVRASIDKSSIVGTEAGLLGVGVAANRIAPIYAFGIAGAAGTSKMAAAASVGVNIIDSNAGKGTFASIQDSEIDNVAHALVQSASESQIISVAGAVAATSGATAVGGAISINEIGSTVSALMVDATVSTHEGIGIYASTASANTEPDPDLTSTFNPDLSREALKKTGVDIFNYYTNPVGTLLSKRESSAAPNIVPVKTMEFISGTAGIYSAAAAGGGSSNVAVFGSATVNTITTAVMGAIRGSSVDAGTGINVLANNGAEIYSAAGAVAISGGVAGIGGAATYNTLRGSSLAEVTDTTASVVEELTVLSDRSGTIRTLAAAAAVASSSGLAGSAAISTLADRTEARLSGVDLSAGTVNLDANATLATTTAAGGLAGGGTSAVGASAAILVSENITQARVGSSSTRHSRINVKDALNVNAISAEEHNSIVMTGSVSAVAGISGSAGIKVMNGQTHARIDNHSLINNLRNGDVSVKAQSKLFASGEAGAVGGGLKAGLGVGLDLIVANGQTTAIIGDDASVRGHNISVDAESAQDFASLSVAAGGGLAGIAGGVSIVQVGGGAMNSEAKQALGQESYVDSEGNERQEGDLFAYANEFLGDHKSGAVVDFTPVPLTDGNTLAYIGASDVSAINDVNVRALATHDVDMTSGAAAGGGVGVGAGISVLSYQSRTSAVTNNARLLAGGDLSVTARDQDASSYRAYWQLDHDGSDPGTDIALGDGDWFAINAIAGSGGLVGLGAAIAIVNRDNSSNAEIRNGQTDAEGSILVDAQRHRHTRINALGAQVGGATLGVSIGTLNENGAVLASAGGNIGSADSGFSIDELTVSTNADNRNVIIVNASAVGIVTGSAAVGVVSGDAINSQARIADDANIFLGKPVNLAANTGSERGSLNINAEGTLRNYLEVSTAGISKAATIGAADAQVLSAAATHAHIGDRANVKVQGNIRQDANLHAGEFVGGNWTSFTQVIGRGASASALVGVASVFTRSAQTLSTLVDVGVSASVNASEGYWFNSMLVHHGEADSLGGAVAGLAAVGVVTAENNDQTDARAEIGENASVTTQAFFSLLRNLSFYKSKTRSLAGSIASANVVQNTRLNNDSTTTRFNLLQGARIAAIQSAEIDISSAYLASGTAQGLSGGASAVNIINASVDADNIIAQVHLNGASVSAGSELVVRANTSQSVNADFNASAGGLGAYVEVNVDTDLDGYGRTHLLNGASLKADKVDVSVSNRQVQYLVSGQAKALALGAVVDASVNNNLRMDSQMFTEEGTQISAADISLVVDDNASLRQSSIEAEIANTSLTFFLSDDEVTDNQEHGKEIRLDGDLVSTSSFGGSLDIETFGQWVLVNGRFQADLNIAGAGQRVLLDTIAPQGSGRIRVDAGDGLVDGTGVFRNASHYLTDVTVRARNSVRVSDIRLIGDPSALDVNIISGNNYQATVVEAVPSTAGEIRFEVGDNLDIEGTVDAAGGSIVINAAKNPATGIVSVRSVSGEGILRGNHVEINSGDRSGIGSEDELLAIQLLDTATANARFEANAPLGIHASVSLEGSSNNAIIDRAVIGDVLSSGAINIEFQDGIRVDDSKAMALYEIQGRVASRGLVTLNALSENTSLVLNGEVRSGLAAGVTEVYVNIVDENVVDTNWDDLSVLFQTSQAEDIDKVVTIGDISNDGESGVKIDAVNLSGTGLVYGNASGLDILINNHWQALDVLRLGNIFLKGGTAAVTINGNDAVASNDFAGIQIQRVDSGGSNDISITDHWSSQLILIDQVETNGKISIDMDRAFTISTFDIGLGLDPVVRANAIDLRVAGSGSQGQGSTIGRSDRPFLIDVGSGGLDVESNGRIFIRDVAGDLVLRGINNRAAVINADALKTTVLDAADGSIIALEGTYTGNRFDLRAANDIDFSRVVVNAVDKVSLDGNNLSWRAVSEGFASSLDLQGITARGDLTLRDELGLGIAAYFVNVAGETYVVSDADIVLSGRFDDAVHLEGINGPFGHNWGFAQIVTPGDLKLGNIKTGFKHQLDPSSSVLLVTAGGNIQQAEGTQLSIHNTTSFTAGGNLILNQGMNEFDQHERLRIMADSAIVNAASDVNLFQLQITKDLAVNLSSGQLTQNGYVRVGGDTTLTTQNGAIELLHSSNAFAGLVAVNANVGSSGAPYALQLNNAGTLRLGDLNISGNMRLFSRTGSVIGHGVITSRGFNRIDARNGSIILDNANNQLDWFGGWASEDVTLVSGDALRVNPFDISGKLTLEADVIQFLERSTIDGDFMASSLAPTRNSAGSMALTARVGPLGTGNQVVAASEQMLQPNRRFTVSGETWLSSPSAVHFDNAAFAGPVNMNSNLGIINQREGDLILGDVNLWGLAASTNLADNSSITGIGSLQVDNQAWFLTRGDLNLLNPTNRLATMDIVSASNVVIRGESDLTLRSGARFVWDVALDSLDIEIGGNFAVAPTADMPGWAFTGMGTSGDVVRVDGDLRIVAGGAFGNLRNGLLVREDAWLQTGAGDLILDANLNSFGGSLDLHAGRNLSVGFVSPLSLPDSGFVPGNTAKALTINSLSAGGNANVEGLTITLGDVQVGGDLTLSTDFYALGITPGVITVNGVARVGGETNIRTMGDVTINNPLNDFTGDINVFDVNTILDKSQDVGLFVNSGRRLINSFYYRMPPANVSIVDRNQLRLGDITLDTNFSATAANIALNGTVQTPGNLSLIANSGTLTGAGNLVIGGDALLSSAGRLTLDGSYQIAGALNLAGGGIHIDAAADDLVVNSLNSTAELNVTANSFTLAPTDINVQSTILGETIIEVVGDLVFNGRFNGYGDVTLKGGAVATNQPFTVGGVLKGQANSMTLTSNSSLTLGSLDVLDDLNLTVANGDISIMAGQIIKTGGHMSWTAHDRDLVFTSGQLELLDVSGDVNLTAQNVLISSNGALNLGRIRATNEDTGFVSISGTDLTVENVRGTSVDLIASDGNIQAGVTGGDKVDGHYRYDASGDIDVVMRAAPTRFIGGTITASGKDIQLDFSSSGGRLRMGDITATGDLWIDNDSSDFAHQKIARGDGILNIGGNIYAGFNSSLTTVALINPENRIGGTVNFDVNTATVHSAQTLLLGDDSVSSRSFSMNLTAHSGNIEYVGAGEFKFETAELSAEQGDIMLPRLHQTQTGFQPTLNVRANNVWLQGSEDNIGLYAGKWSVNGDLMVDLSASTNANADLKASGYMSSFRNDQLRIKGTTTLLTNNQSGVLLDGYANRFLGGINIEAGSVVLNAGIDADKLSEQLQQMQQQMPPDEDTDSDAEFWRSARHLDLGTFKVLGPVNIMVDVPGVTFHEAIDMGAMTFWVRSNPDNVQGSITAANTGNRIQASAGAADITLLQALDFYFVDRPLDAQAGLADNIHILDSTDLSTNRLASTGDVKLVSAGDIRLRGGVDSGHDIVLAAGANFHNDSGLANPLSATTGRWLVYSTRPDQNSNIASMSRDFFDYGVTFDSNNPQPSGLPAGNGLLYEVLPVVAGLTLTPLDQSIIYGQDFDRTVSSTTLGNLSGEATGELLVNGVVVDKEVFGIDLTTLAIDQNNLVLSLNESVVTRSGAGFVSVGNYNDAIVVSLSDPAANRYSVGVGGSSRLSVTPKSVDFSTVNVIDRAYDGTTDADLVFTSSTGFLAGDVASFSGNGQFATANAANNIAVSVSGIGLTGIDAANYSFTGDSTAMAVGTINPRDLVINLDAQNRVYDGTNVAILSRDDYRIAGFVAGEIAALDKNGIFNSANVGQASSVTVALTVDDFLDHMGGFNPNNYRVEDTVTALGAITPAALTITAKSGSRVYNGAGFSGGFGVNTVGLVAGEDLSIFDGELIYSGSSQGAIDVGNYVLSVAGLSNNNYRIQYRSAGLEITPALLTVRANDVQQVYNGNTFFGGDGVTLTGLQGDDTLASLDGNLSYTGSSQGALNVGSYGLSASGLFSSNYNINYAAGTLAITPAELTVRVADVERTYDGTAFTGGSSITTTGFVAGEGPAQLSGNLVWGGNAQNASNAGTYSISADGLTADNYQINFVDGTLHINQRLLTLALQTRNRIYDGTTNIALTRSDFGLSGLVAGQQTDLLVNGNFNSSQVLQADTVSVTVTDANFANGTGGFDIANYRYEGTISKTGFGISAAPLQIAANDLTQTYQGVAFDGDTGLTPTGLVAGESLSDLEGTLVWSGNAKGAVDVGNYTAMVGGLFSDNYEISYKAGTLQIVPRELIAKAVDLTRTYDGTMHKGGSIRWEGFAAEEDSAVLSGNLVWLGSAEESVNAGVFDLLAGGLSSTNYSIDWQPGTLTTYQAALDITVKNAQMIYDGSAWQGGNGVDYSGFVAGENESVLSGALVYGGSAQGAVNAGDYSLTASGLESSNYFIDWQPSVLTIDPRQLVVQLSTQNKFYDATTHAVLDASDFRLSGFASGESARLNVTSGTWNSKHVIDATTVTASVNSDSLIDMDGGFLSTNYVLPTTVSNQTSFIQASNLRLIVQDVNKTYDGQMFQGGKILSEGFKGSDTLADLDGTLELGGTAQGAVNAGSYEITATGYESTNYLIDWQLGSLNVEKADLTITANNAIKAFDGQSWQGGNGVTVLGLVDDDTLADVESKLVFSGSAQGAREIGIYSLVAGGLNLDNYAIKFVNGILTIEPNPISSRLLTLINQASTSVPFSDNNNSLDVTESAIEKALEMFIRGYNQPFGEVEDPSSNENQDQENCAPFCNPLSRFPSLVSLD